MEQNPAASKQGVINLKKREMEGKTHQRLDWPANFRLLRPPTSSHDQLEVQDEENDADHMVGVLEMWLKHGWTMGFHQPKNVDFVGLWDSSDQHGIVLISLSFTLW